MPDLWPVLTLISVAGLVGVHLWWRSRLLRERRICETRLAGLEQARQDQSLGLERRQQALFDSMAEGVLLLDQAGRIELANRAFVRMFDLSGDLRSRTILEALRVHELAEIVQSASTGKEVLGQEFRLLWPRERWVQVNAAPTFRADGQQNGTILVFHDVTRLKQLERTREEFVANVSHELRTPLSLIKGYVETLLDGAKDNPATAIKFLQSIDRNAERLKLLIEDLLTISEIESGRVKLNLQPVALNAISQKVVGDFRTRAGSREVQLIDRIPELRALADAGRLEQVLGNLVDNAIKYGRAGGTVTLGAAAANGQIEVSIRDDGPGIPPESIDRVFERFYRVDKARSREQGGTGLGLSIVKHIIQSHGGRAWVESELGRGATFFFTLPQAPAV